MGNPLDGKELRHTEDSFVTSRIFHVEQVGDSLLDIVTEMLKQKQRSMFKVAN